MQRVGTVCLSMGPGIPGGGASTTLGEPVEGAWRLGLHGHSGENSSEDRAFGRNPSVRSGSEAMP